RRRAVTRRATALPGRDERWGGGGPWSGPLSAPRGNEARHGFAGARRTLGGGGGHFGPHRRRAGTRRGTALPGRGEPWGAGGAWGGVGGVGGGCGGRGRRGGGVPGGGGSGGGGGGEGGGVGALCRPAAARGVHGRDSVWAGAGGGGGGVGGVLGPPDVH